MLKAQSRVFIMATRQLNIEIFLKKLLISASVEKAGARLFNALGNVKYLRLYLFRII